MFSNPGSMDTNMGHALSLIQTRLGLGPFGEQKKKRDVQFNYIIYDLCVLIKSSFYVFSFGLRLYIMMNAARMS